MLLFRREWLHPREKQRTKFLQPVLSDLFFGPVVILLRADDKLHFVGSFQVRDVFKTVARHLAAARTFQIHDAAHARIDLRNVVRAAGFDQHRETFVAQCAHEGQGVGLKQRFAAGQFDEGQFQIADFKLRIGKKRGESPHFGKNFFHRLLFTLRERIRRVAIRAAEIARRQPHEHARQPGESAFALQAEIDFVDDQRVGHERRLKHQAQSSKLQRSSKLQTPNLERQTVSRTCCRLAPCGLDLGV